MARIAVVYSSAYGSTKQYAQWIAAALGADLLALTKQSAQNLAAYDIIVCGGGLYAGQIAGMPLIRKYFPAWKSKPVALFTVGLVPPQNLEYYRELLRRQLSPEMHAKIRAFHFPGGIDYSRLSARHRAVMNVLRFALKRKNPQKLSDDERAILASFGKAVNAAEESNIEPLLGYICGLE